MRKTRRRGKSETTTFLLEEYRNLRSSISRKQDSMFYILAFTLAMVGTIFTFIAKEDLQFSVLIVCAIFGLSVLTISFVLIIRLIYSIKTIGGYIQVFLEPELFGGTYRGWENGVTDLKTVKTKKFFILAGGTHVSFGIFYSLISFVLLALVVVKAIVTYDIDPRALDPVLLILPGILLLLFAFLHLLILMLNRKIRSWKPAWSELKARYETPGNGFGKDTAAFVRNRRKD